MMRKAVAIAALLALAACADAGRPQLPVATAPLPKQYDCELSRKAAAELRALPPDAALRTYLDDYHELRIRLRALHKLPEPTPCPKPPPPAPPRLPVIS